VRSSNCRAEQHKDWNFKTLYEIIPVIYYTDFVRKQQAN
jgi:hypothetical protein